MTKYAIIQKGARGYTTQHSLSFYMRKYGTMAQRVEAGITKTLDSSSIHHAKKVLAYVRKKNPRMTFKLVKTVQTIKVLEV